MAHIGQEPRLQLVGAAQVIGLFVQFRIQRHHAAIGIFQFPIQPGQFDLPGADLLQRVEQLLILMLQFLKCVLRTLAGQRRRQAGRSCGFPDARSGSGSSFFSQMVVPLPGRGIDLELVHQTAGAQDTHAHAGGGFVAAFQDVLQVAHSWPGIPDLDNEQLRRRAAFDRIFHAAAAGIIERVARDLGHSGGNPRLILGVETQQPGDLPGALPRRYGIALGSDREGKNGPSHLRRLCNYNCSVIAAPAEIPVEHARDQRGIARRQARIGFQSGAGGKPVGMQNQQPIFGPGITELLNSLALMPGGSVQRHQILPRSRSRRRCAPRYCPRPANVSLPRARSMRATATAAPRVAAQRLMNPRQQRLGRQVRILMQLPDRFAWTPAWLPCRAPSRRPP